ncbi:hypothetical protein T484DRAFT_1989388, partial [Baffinella frigidus]
MVPHAGNGFVKRMASGTTFKRRLVLLATWSYFVFLQELSSLICSRIRRFRKNIVGAVLSNCARLVLRVSRFTDSPRNHQGRTPEELATESGQHEVAKKLQEWIHVTQVLHPLVGEVNQLAALVELISSP